MQLAKNISQDNYYIVQEVLGSNASVLTRMLATLFFCCIHDLLLVQIWAYFLIKGCVILLPFGIVEL